MPRSPFPPQRVALPVHACLEWPQTQRKLEVVFGQVPNEPGGNELKGFIAKPVEQLLVPDRHGAQLSTIAHCVGTEALMLLSGSE